MAAVERKRKRRRGAEPAANNSADPYICEDILVDILHRLPARSAIRCAALSKRHQKLISTSKFWHDQQCRLAPPLPPHHHVAYLSILRPAGDATAGSTALPWPDCAFHDFHFTGAAGLRSGIFQEAKATEKYVGTCNGVVLLAAKASLRGVLFNPAVPHGERAVCFPCPHPAANGKARRPKTRYRVSGLGYGPSSGAYKLVVTRQVLKDPDKYRTTELLVCTLGKPGERPRKVLSGLDARIRGASIYMDGTVYLLDVNTSAVLALHVDGETATPVALPGYHVVSVLMEVSGRVCVAMADGPTRTALWLLAPGDGHRWERRFICDRKLYSLVGAWDCGGGSLLLLTNGTGILLSDGSSSSKVVECATPRSLTMEKKTEYALCWGYRPTIVSPRSIIGARSHVRQNLGRIYDIVEPVIELHKERARAERLHVKCVMELLLQVMRTLPQEREHFLKQQLRLFGTFQISSLSN